MTKTFSIHFCGIMLLFGGIGSKYKLPPHLYLKFVFERCFELKEEKIESKIWNPKSRSGASEEVGQLSQKGKAATFAKLFSSRKEAREAQKGGKLKLSSNVKLSVRL